jgi:hypothetical protein
MLLGVVWRVSRIFTRSVWDLPAVLIADVTRRFTSIVG